MSAVNRREFLTRGSIAVAAAGVVAAVPGLTSVLAIGESEAPAAADTAAADTAVATEAAGTMTEPIVAHVRDLATGEIGVYSGTQEFVFRDPTLANRIFNATR
jgi:hypothetical protein